MDNTQDNNFKIKALIFDMDGLIFDSERLVRRTWDIAGARLGLGSIGTDHIFNTLGFNVVKREEYFKGIYGSDFPMNEFNTITRKAFQDIADTEGVTMKPGVKELLTYAQKHGLKTAVATSSRRVYSTGLLRNAGIWNYFTDAIFGDMVTQAKPAPEIYLKAAALIHVEPKNCIALEDSPNGIRSSYAAGMHPIMVPDLVQPTAEIREMCWKVCDSLLEVTGLIL